MGAVNPAAPVPHGALAMQWHGQRRHLSATLLVMLVLCSGITLIVAGFQPRRLPVAAAYTFPIGFCCWGLNALLRLGLAAAQDAVDRARGHALRTQGWGCGWAAVLPATVLSLLFGPPLGMSMGDALTGLRSPSLLDWGSHSTQVTLGISLVASVLATWAISSIERLAAAREAAMAAQRAAAENQLRLLQSQLEPHMLFNTLANLRVLIGLDAAAAQQMLDRLIAFLRATLEASRTPEHPLATEFARVADYLALMAIRMGPRLQVRLELPPALAPQPVPPLLLQPLVENAIRHGLEPHVGGGRLEVSARAEGDTLVLEVRNTGVGLAAAAASGTPGTRFGLAQVRERLAMMHGERAGLSLEDAAEGGGTCARIRLPLQPGGGATAAPQAPAAHVPSTRAASR
jgi:signal transduction histidine kinase